MPLITTEGTEDVDPTERMRLPQGMQKDLNHFGMNQRTTTFHTTISMSRVVLEASKPLYSNQVKKSWVVMNLS